MNSNAGGDQEPICGLGEKGDSPSGEMTYFVGLNSADFADVFRWHFAFDESMRLTQLGYALRRLCPNCQRGMDVSKAVLSVYPRGELSPEFIRRHGKRSFLLEIQHLRLRLRGEIRFIGQHGVYVFIGSPWFTDAEELVRFGLHYDDFAVHDPVVDMLQLFQSNKVALEDAKRLSLRLTEQSSELRRAMAALDSMEDAVIIFSPEGYVVEYANQGAERQLGREREDLSGLGFLELFDGVSEGDMQAALRPMEGGEVRSVRLMGEMKRKGGALLAVEAVIQGVYLTAGRRSYVALVRDISQRLEREKAERRTQRLESIGLLASGLAHDLNNSLTPILLVLEYLRGLVPQEKELLDTLEDSAKRASAVVRQLLTIGKGNEGIRMEVDFSKLFHEISTIIRSTFPKNIQFDLAAQPGLPTCMGDDTQLHQLLLNLCVNARDAMPRGGTLSLRSGLVQVDETFAASTVDGKPGQYVLVEVEDTGIGMPPSVMEKLFTPFFTTKSPDKGTGMGLVNVAGIVKSHGGFLTLDSKVGRGTVFRIYLPVGEAGSADSHGFELPVHLDGGGGLALVVDDEPAVRESTRLVLERFNFRVMLASDGLEALVKAVDHRDALAVVLTDIHMPRMDGLAFAKAIKEMRAGLPVVAMGGRLDDELRDELSAAGVEEVLRKPFDERSLLRVLARVTSNG